MKSKLKTNITILLLFLSIVVFLSLPLIKLKVAEVNHPVPNAILTLGGSIDREKFTFNFAKTHPNLPIWISSGSPPECVCHLFTNAGLQNPLILDYSAVDTVTNFTSLVQKLKNNDINHVFIITSKSHMPRAQALATIVLGSQSIAFTPVTASSARNTSRESIWRKARDIARAYLWILIGKTGASFVRQFHPPSALLDPVNCFD